MTPFARMSQIGPVAVTPWQAQAGIAPPPPGRSRPRRLAQGLLAMPREAFMPMLTPLRRLLLPALLAFSLHPGRAQAQTPPTTNMAECSGSVAGKMISGQAYVVTENV